MRCILKSCCTFYTSLIPLEHIMLCPSTIPYLLKKNCIGIRNSCVRRDDSITYGSGSSGRPFEDLRLGPTVGTHDTTPAVYKFVPQQTIRCTYCIVQQYILCAAYKVSILTISWNMLYICFEIK
jgi:hypothetical protein